jgi:hypothetical protein
MVAVKSPSGTAEPKKKNVLTRIACGAFEKKSCTACDELYGLMYTVPWRSKVPANMLAAKSNK